jgi:hypothetical protein
MRSRVHPSKLKEITTVRGLQRIKAEVQAAKAAAELRDKSGILSDTIDEQAAIEEAWGRSVSERSMQIEMTALWSQALVGQIERVRQANDAVEVSKRGVRKRSEELLDATNRDCEAKDLEKRAAKDASARRDEAHMAQVLDRYALRAVRP